MSTNQDNELQNSPNLSAFYANSLSVSASGYDISVLFSREMPTDDGPVKVDNLMVYMSPMLVKRFTHILASIVERYEKSFGVIPLPPEGQIVKGDLDDTDEDSQ
jgi:hypothetical protein